MQRADTDLSRDLLTSKCFERPGTGAEGAQETLLSRLPQRPRNERDDLKFKLFWRFCVCGFKSGHPRAKLFPHPPHSYLIQALPLCTSCPCSHPFACPISKCCWHFTQHPAKRGVVPYPFLDMLQQKKRKAKLQLILVTSVRQGCCLL